MTPWETDLLHAAAELARVKRLHAQTFLLGVLPIGDTPPKYRTDKQAWAAADEEHIEQLLEAEARYEIAKSRLVARPETPVMSWDESGIEPADRYLGGTD